MNVRVSESRELVADEEHDDLQSWLNDVAFERPGIGEARDDLSEMQEVLDALVALRKQLGLSQRDVADRMGVKQPTISQFETESSDPKLSTLQRYARALKTRVRVHLGDDLCGASYETSHVFYSQDVRWAVVMTEPIRLQGVNPAVESAPAASFSMTGSCVANSAAWLRPGRSAALLAHHALNGS